MRPKPTPTPSPPRAHRALLRTLLADTVVGRTVLGDLDEEHAARAAGPRGPRAAHAWYRREARRVALWAVRQRLAAGGAWWRRRSAGGGGVMGEGDGIMAGWSGEARVAARSLLRAPGFTAVAVLTLGLGVGAATAVFGVVHGILLDPLPFEEPDALMVVRSSAPGVDVAPEFKSSLELLLAYRERAPLVQRAAGYNAFGATLRAEGVAERLRFADVTHDFFATLGVEPLLGRLPSRDAVEAEPFDLIAISHALWVRSFGADPAVLGRSVEIGERLRTVVAVMPPGIDFPNDETTAWLPFVAKEGGLTPGRWNYDLLVRVPDGTRAEELAAQLDPVAAGMPERYGSYPEYVDFMTEGRYRPVVRPLLEHHVRGLDDSLWILFGSAGLLLLIATANVTNLSLARAETRSAETAIRAALGAGRARLLRAQLTEALVLAFGGGALGVALANVGIPLLFLGGPAGRIPRATNVAMSPEVVAFAALATVLSAVTYGLLPALRQAAAPALARVGGMRPGTGPGRRAQTLRDVLVVVQAAVALVLLVGSGLLVRSWAGLNAIDPGWDASDVLTFQVSPPDDRYPGALDVAAFHRHFLERVASLPGVRSVGAIRNLPLHEFASQAAFVVEDRAATAGTPAPVISYNFVSAGYFATMGIALEEGRDFLGTDDPRDRGAVVVSRGLAERYWPGSSALGERLRFGSVDDSWHTVVGVVEDARERDLRAAASDMLYFPFLSPAGSELWVINSPAYVVKAADPEGLVPAIRTELRDAEPSAPLYLVQTMERVASDSLGRLSFTMMALLVSAGMALVLGAVGLYGVLSYVVSRRAREMGIRLALGARRSGVRRLMVARGLRLTVLGLLIGLLAAAFLSRLLAGLLYATDPLDPATFAAMSAAMLGVGFVASWVPAARASSVDPVESMRVD